MCRHEAKKSFKYLTMLIDFPWCCGSEAVYSWFYEPRWATLCQQNCPGILLNAPAEALLWPKYSGPLTVVAWLGLFLWMKYEEGTERFVCQKRNTKWEKWWLASGCRVTLLSDQPTELPTCIVSADDRPDPRATCWWAGKLFARRHHALARECWQIWVPSWNGWSCSAGSLRPVQMKQKLNICYMNI